MKILFVLPGIGKKPGERYLKSWLMEPLTIAVLARLTPDKHQVAFFDDRIEHIDYDYDADLVAITTEAYTAKRAYQIADRFRAQGKRVVMGGYHATLAPEDARPHADILMRGNAEGVWARMLDDVANGNFQPLYEGTPALDYGIPDRSIYADKMKKYLPISLVEIGRGCRYNCEFCSISTYYDHCYLHRRIEDIVEEIKSCPHKLFFFVDDSIFSDKAFARELFEEIAKLNIIWTTQVTLDVGRDEELLQLMRKSGCVLILIGFESIDSSNLEQMNKDWSVRFGERDDLVERIHRAGINIYASFVFGFDFDDEQSFEQVFEFCERHAFFVIAFNHLLAFPGTATYQRFAEEKRLTSERWWMEKGYRYGTISYRPARLSQRRLRALCGEYKHRYFTFRSIIRRGRKLWSRSRNLLVHFAFWYQNLLFHFEVDKRIDIPVGENLDE